MKSIDVHSAKELLSQDNITLIDVREKDEYEHAHIPGAILMPLSTFDPTAIPDQEDKHLVFHCRSGRRCGMAAEKALHAGYTGTIKRMEGGFLAWDAAGFDSEPG